MVLDIEMLWLAAWVQAVPFEEYDITNVLPVRWIFSHLGAPADPTVLAAPPLLAPALRRCWFSIACPGACMRSPWPGASAAQSNRRNRASDDR
jgi:hypothetical protein